MSPICKTNINREEEICQDLATFSGKIRALYESDDKNARHVFNCYRTYVCKGEFDHLSMFVDPQKACIDVGANAGHYALKLAAISTACLSIEPLHSLSYVKDYLPDNCIFCNVAVGREPGTGMLRIPRFNETIDTGQATLLPNTSINGATYDEQITEVSTIDLLVKKFLGEKPVGFIKMDVEGFEYSALEGAAETLLRCRPNLQIELHGNLQRTCDFISSFHYRGLFFFDGQLLDFSQFDAKKHRAPENEYNSRKQNGLPFEPTKFVCDFYFIPVK